MIVGLKKIKLTALFAILISCIVPTKAAAFDSDAISKYLSENKKSGIAIALAPLLWYASFRLGECLAEKIWGSGFARKPLTDSEKAQLEELISLPKIPKTIGIPDFVKSYCTKPVGLLPLHIQELAHEARLALQVPPTFFYHTNNYTSFAANIEFNQIGLKNLGDASVNVFDLLNPNSKRPEMVPADQYLYLKELNTCMLLFTLYHELLHIKYRHSDAHDSTIRIVNEMLAELGAIYYILTLTPRHIIIRTGIDAYILDRLSHCIEDNAHPAFNEQVRYNKELVKRLYANKELYEAACQDPNRHFDEIVSPLVVAYLEEKKTGTVAEFNHLEPSGSEEPASSQMPTHSSY